MTNEEYLIINSYPLDIKVEKTKARIREWVKHFGIDNVYISFSGGKDSTVLLDIAREIYPEIKAAYCDTGLEYPEIKEFVKTFDNVDIIRPTKSFKTVINEFGYPIISKEQSQYIHEIRNSTPYMKQRRLNGDSKGRFKLSNKWKFVLDAPFDVSHKCCHYMKKKPFRDYEKETDRVPILATLACESILRKQHYLRNGCNSFKSNKSQPLGFWSEEDILEYIVTKNLKIAPIYGEIVKEDGHYKILGVNRTGCIFCGFGVQREGNPNRFQCLKKSHPKLHEYVINGGEYIDGKLRPDNKGLGFGKVLDYIGVETN